MSNEKKYPSIVNRSGQAPREYIGIMFNGDQGVYRKATVKALKKYGASKANINAVKAADGVDPEDYSLVRLGKAGRTRHMGIRPTVRGSVMNPNDHPHGGGEGRSKTVSQLSEAPDIHAIIAETDKSIDERAVSAYKKLEDIHEGTAKAVLEKYREACARKLKKLEKEIHDIQDEQKRMESIIIKIS